MKKIRVLLCGLFLFSLIFVSSCEKKKLDVFANVSNSTEKINSGKDNLTVGEIYDEIRNSQNSNVSKYLLEEIIKKEISLTEDDTKTLYKKYLNEEFNELFNTQDTYKVNGKFEEDLLVEYLKSESYNITCDGNYTTLLESPFTCNYQDYIEKEVNLDIYMKILKIKYIIEEKSDLINKQEGRLIGYYNVSVSSSEVNSVREDMVNYVNFIAQNHDSTSNDVIKSIEDVANDKKMKDIKNIEDEFKKLSTSDDSNFSILNKYTTCGNIRCSVEEGKQYLIDNATNYYAKKVVIKSDDSILYESARNLLFDENIEEYLYTIGNKKYLISPIYANDVIRDVKDIILFNNVSSSLAYYLVEVEVIDSNSSFLDQAQIAELLLEKISDSDVLAHFFEKSEIKIYDNEINDLFVEMYGDYKGE